MIKVLGTVMLVSSLLWPQAALAEKRGGAAAKAGEQEVLGNLKLLTPEGNPVYLVPFIGRKAVVVVFWASWCPLCREEIPRLNRMNANSQVKVIGVNEGESAGTAAKFAARNKVGYETVVDPDGAVARAFRVSGVPYCVILGRSGLIVYRGSAVPDEIDYYLNQ